MLGLLATVVALGAAPSPAWRPDVDAAEAFARTRHGQVTFAVRTRCGAWGHRQDRPAPSASVLKAMLLVAYLQRGAVREQPLDRGQRRLLAPMVRWSSNVAASRVLGVIGLARMQQAAARWGMRRFRLGDPWGHSAITAREQARFWLHLDGRVPPRHRVYALRLLRTVVPAQRWGVARVTPRGWTLHFKGGWGSGSGAVDHQTALLTRGDERVSLAILTTAQGTHRYGRATLRGIAARLTRRLAAAQRVC